MAIWVGYDGTLNDDAGDGPACAWDPLEVVSLEAEDAGYYEQGYDEDPWQDYLVGVDIAASFGGGASGGSSSGSPVTATATATTDWSASMNQIGSSIGAAFGGDTGKDVGSAVGDIFGSTIKGAEEGGWQGALANLAATAVQKAVVPAIQAASKSNPQPPPSAAPSLAVTPAAPPARNVRSVDPRTALLNTLGRLAKKYGMPSPAPVTMADIGLFVSDVAKAKPPQQGT